MIKTDIIINITNDMALVLTQYQLKKLKETLENNLKKVEINILTDEKEKQQIKETNDKYINIFLSAKEVEGCSTRTLKYYREIIEKLINTIDKPIEEIQTEEIRKYLADYKENTKCNTVTIDNLRRVLSSFFAWLEDEDYIIKSPVRRIHKVKTPTIIKETLTDENLEKLRDTSKCIRDLVLIELLYSTGIRVGELIKLNISDINFEDRSCKVFGKGNKQREVYFDARTKIHLRQYINARKDENEALFVSKNKPHQRLSIAGIELIVRKLGLETEINKVHPHKFRRTLATMAIDKGMPIEQLQQLLGHKRIDTTLQYAMVKQSNVKLAHKKYIG